MPSFVRENRRAESRDIKLKKKDNNSSNNISLEPEIQNISDD